MTQLYNPLERPSVARENELSVYLKEISWTAENNLLTLSVGLMSQVGDVTSFGLRTHYDSTNINYVSDSKYSLNQAVDDTLGQGLDNVITAGIVKGSGHIKVLDASDYDGSASTTAFVKTNWSSSFDSKFGAMQPWPGATDVNLFEINFTVVDPNSTLTFGFSADQNDLKEGYNLATKSTKVFEVSLSENSGSGSPDLAGIVLSRGGGMMPDVSVTLDYSNSSSQLVTKSSSLGKFTMEVNSGVSAKILADIAYVNSSSKDAINAQDVLETLRLSAGLKTSEGSNSPLDYVAADFNKNGKVTAHDALNLLKYTLGVGDLDANWVFVDSAGDYSAITNSNVTYAEGFSAQNISANLNISMTGILLGDVNDTYTSYLDVI